MKNRVLFLVLCVFLNVGLALGQSKEDRVNSEAVSKAWNLKAVSDFKIAEGGKATYYKDKRNGALAVNAADKSQRDVFASAEITFEGKPGFYKPFLRTMTENDGESVYKILLNGNEIITITNPKTKVSFERVTHDLDVIMLKTNDIVEIQSKAVTNGEIPENDGTAWSRGRWTGLDLIPKELLSNKKEFLQALLKDVVPFEENEGLLEVEAEDFHHKSNNGSPRDWYVRSKTSIVPIKDIILEDHADSASGEAYLEALPDTRVTHDDTLVKNENFFGVPGTGGTVSYKVKIQNPGTYYVWVRAYSTGSEDNGLHVGLDGEWPESGARMQWCKGKNSWAWSSAQRTKEKHCGIPQKITLNIKEKGIHYVTFSMREDGFEFDKFILSKAVDFRPE
ncbi:hypothetical protein [Hyunsoonleella aquatilis]|uniref:hypothetical protein n=1 Tax=Hyunsoonleella aquatilis TaxID=2762758 RepID=UPI001C994C38|nr:hypothetical protein [Hyunsoonleella aquatilis]